MGATRLTDSHGATLASPPLQRNSTHSCLGPCTLCAGMLKRSCFLPLLKNGVPKKFAGLATFVASALMHEVQFAFSFASYTIGRASAFFVLQGVLCLIETLICAAVPGAGDSIPPTLKRILTVSLMTVTSEMFVSIWRDSAMFDASKLRMQHSHTRSLVDR